MAPLPIKLRRIDGDLSSDEIDDNFQFLKEACELALDQSAQGIQIDDIYLTSDGLSLMIRMTNEVEFGPFPIPVLGFRIMGAWLDGISYQRNDLALVEGSSYVCTQPHVSDDFDDDLAALRWQLVAGASTATGGSGSTAIHLSLRIPGAATVGQYDRVVVPIACTLVAAGVRSRLRAAPGAAKNIQIAMGKYIADNSIVPTGGIEFSGTATAGAAVIAGGSMSFMTGDVLEMGVFSVDSGHTADDVAVTFTLQPIA